MFDISRLLPGFQVFGHAVTPTATWQKLIPPNPQRVGLYINNSASAPINYQPDVPGAPALGTFHTLPSGSQSAYSWILDGPLSSLGWWIQFGAGSGTIYWLEVLWFPENLGK